MKQQASPYYTFSAVSFLALFLVSISYTLLSHVYCAIFGYPPIQHIDPHDDIDSTSSSNGNKKDQAKPRKVVVITGSNSGVGFATAKALVVDHGMIVVLACRSRDKGMAAAQEINKHTRKGAGEALFIHPCDLASFNSVREFSQVLHQKYPQIDILINNAGISNSLQGRSRDSLEIIFQSNVTGHFLLTGLLMDLFPADNQQGRIINLSSDLHHFAGNRANMEDKAYWLKLMHIDLSKKSWLPPQWRATTIDFGCSYPPSKLAAILFSIQLNKLFSEKKKNIRSFAVNPGAVHSNIWDDTPSIFKPLFWLCLLSCEQGATTSIAAAVGSFEPDALYLQPYWVPESATRQPAHPVQEAMGPYIGYKAIQPRLPPDGGLAAAKALWGACEDVTGFRT